MIEFNCSACGNLLRVGTDAEGKRGKCPKCGKELIVPAAETVILEAVDSLPAPSEARGFDGGPSLPQPGRAAQPKRSHRLWVAILLSAATISIAFYPKFPLWLGICLLILFVAAFIPQVRPLSNRLLRLEPDHKWSRGIRIAMYGLIGVFLLLGGMGGLSAQAANARIAAAKAAQQAEQQQRTDQANREVATLVQTAEAAWKSGNLESAAKTLQKADRVSDARDFSSVRRLRTQMANAEVDSLMIEAVDAAKRGDVDASKAKVSAAISVEHADALSQARELERQLNLATDVELVHATILGLSDDAFVDFVDSKMVPPELSSDYEQLEDQIRSLAESQIEAVTAEREQRAREEIARRQAREESARKAEEERVAREAAAEKEKQEKEAAAREAEQKKAREERIQRGFSAWNGSHIELTKLIKAAMNDPKSYEHVETVYWDQVDYLIVKTTYRGKNGFGGVVVNWVKAQVELDGHVIAVIEQGP